MELLQNKIGYHGYPCTTCTSVNDVICHGFPKNQKLKEGDLVTNWNNGSWFKQLFIWQCMS